MAAPTLTQVTAAASDLKLLSLYSDLEIWIEHASDQRRGDTPEASIANLIFDGLHDLRAQAETMISRLALSVAAKDAADVQDLEGADA